MLYGSAESRRLFSCVEIIVIACCLELGACVLGPVDLGYGRLTCRLLGVYWIELLTELIELVQVVGRHRAAGSVESFLEMSACDDGHWIFSLHVCIGFSACKTLAVLFGSNSVSDGSFCGALAKLRNISTCKVLGEL